MPNPKAASARRSPVDPLSNLLGYQLRRASSAALATLAAELAQHGLSVLEASVLAVIAENRAGITQSEIGRLLDIHRANVVPIAAKLAAVGATTSEALGRQNVLRLSPRGQRMAKAVRATMEKHDRCYLAELRADQRAQLLSWLRTVWQQ